MIYNRDGKNQGQRNRFEYVLGERRYGFPGLIVKDAALQVNMHSGISTTRNEYFYFSSDESVIEGIYKIIL